MEFLDVAFMGKPIWMWKAFLALVIILLVVDLGILHRKMRAISAKESLWMSAIYITIGLLFGGWVWYELGAASGQEYLTGFLVEKTLAMDNVFVISLIFGYFAVPTIYQHRVLFWGILGVILLRGIMIGVGATLVAKFSWILYIFAAFMILTGIKMLILKDHTPNIENNIILRFLRSVLRVTPELHEQKFFVRIKSDTSNKTMLYVTPLFVTLILIEIVDLIFAVDSVPAIFAITTDPFIVYTSNIFAILGLRALYFALAAIIDRFHYLKQALALVLIFIGAKIFIADLFNWQKFPASLSLGVTVSLIIGGVIYSMWKTRKAKS